MTKVAVILFLSLLIIGCAREDREQAGIEQAEELSGEQKDLEQAPDEMLSSFSLSGYTKGGKRQWELEGKSADISMEVINLIDVTGKVYGRNSQMNIVADEGSLNRRSNSVHLEKNVLVTTEDGATLNTDSLDWDAQSQRLSSETLVRLKKGMMRARGEGLIARPELKLVELKRDVTVEVSFVPEQGNDIVSLPPTIIICDGPLEVAYENNLAIFKDNVRVKDTRGEIFADYMEVYFTSGNESSQDIQGMEGMSIKKVLAKGDVEIHRRKNITYSQKAVYEMDTGRLTLTGQPKLVIYSTEDMGRLMETGEGKNKGR